jgi:hypothetical protein
VLRNQRPHLGHGDPQPLRDEHHRRPGPRVTPCTRVWALSASWGRDVTARTPPAKPPAA